MITSLKNPRVKLVRALQTSRRARERERLFVVEGRRLLEEVARKAAPATYVLHHDHLSERERGLVNRLAGLGAEVEPVADDVAAAVSATETPPGLLAVLPYPTIELPAEPSLTLVCDRIRDPGNLGTMLRTAEAAGVDLVLVGPGTVDVFNPKVVRGAAGAHLRLPILACDWEGIRVRMAGVQCVLASAHSGRPYFDVNWTGRAALMLSHEASGSSRVARELAAEQVHIPMTESTESLNVAVAAGVLLMEAARQRARVLQATA